MAAQRADIGVLRGGARAHRALAQVDLLEARARRRRIEVEQRALRDGEPDRAFDVARGEILAALDVLVEAFEHAARLLDGVARAVERDVIAALLGDDAEPALDQREVLAVLAEQHRGVAVVVEGEHDLRRRRFGGGHQSLAGSERAQRHQAPMSSASMAAAAMRGAGAFASVPNRLLVPTSVMVTGAISPISDAGADDRHRLQIWRAADDLARMAARLVEQHVEGHADAARHERGLLPLDVVLQALQPLVLHGFRQLIHVGGRRAGPRRIFERVGAGEADLGDQPQRVAEIVLGLARKADDEIRRERDVGPRARAAARRCADSRRGCGGGSSLRGCGRSRTAPADAVAASAPAGRDARRSGCRPCRADGWCCSAAARCRECPRGGASAGRASRRGRPRPRRDRR